MKNKRPSPIFLMLGLVFLTIGMSTRQDAFTYTAIVFLVIALITNRSRRRPG